MNSTHKVANRRKRVVGRAKKTPRAPVTAADLDAQMEVGNSYTFL